MLPFVLLDANVQLDVDPLVTADNLFLLVIATRGLLLTGGVDKRE
jgi:hypothetical protein